MTAARARKLANEIRESQPAEAVGGIIPDIKAEAQRGGFTIQVQVPSWYGDSTKMLEALGYKVNVYPIPEGAMVKVSW